MATQKIITRDFLLAFFSQFALASVFYILIPTLPIYLSRLGSNEVEIGILIGILSVFALIFRPFVGRALLKIPERNFMVAGALLYAFTSVVYLITPPFWPFLLVRVFQGIGMAFFYTASVTLITNISGETNRGQSLSYFFLAFNLAFALAPLFGMFFINRFSFNYLFLVCSGISLCSLFFTIRLGKGQINPSLDSSIEDGSLSSRKAIPSSIVYFFSHFIWGGITTFFPLYALDHGMTNPGLFFAAYAITLILSRALGGRILDLYSREKVILPALAAFVIAMILLTFSKTLPMFILVAVIWGIGNAFLTPALMAYAIDLVGSSRGPTVGIFTAIGDFGTGMGSVIMGIILRLTNYQTMFLCLALTGIINLNYFYFFVRKEEVFRAILKRDEYDR